MKYITKKNAILNIVIANISAETEDKGLKEIIDKFYIQKFEIPKIKEEIIYTLEDYETAFRKMDFESDKINLFDQFYQRGLMTTNYDDQPLTQFEVTFENFTVHFDKEFKYTNPKSHQYYIRLSFNNYTKYERKVEYSFPRSVILQLLNLDKNINKFKAEQWEGYLTEAQKLIKTRSIAKTTLQNILDTKFENSEFSYAVGPQEDSKYQRINIYNGDQYVRTYKIDLDNLNTQIDSIMVKLNSLS